QPGQTDLILGATGVAGKRAIQIAKHWGAGRIVAAGRNKRVLETLPDLGADAIIPLNQPDQGLTAAFLEEARRGHFDIILDYLWGHPTEVLLDALTGHDLRAKSTRSRLVEIGEMAGPTISLSAAASRSSGLQLSGSGGGGSMPHTANIDAFPQLWALAADGTLHIDTEPVALADVRSEEHTSELQSRFDLVCRLLL